MASAKLPGAAGAARQFLGRHRAGRVLSAVVLAALCLEPLSLLLRGGRAAGAGEEEGAAAAAAAPLLDLPVPEDMYVLRSQRVLYCWAGGTNARGMLRIVRKREGVLGWDLPRPAESARAGLQLLEKLPGSVAQDCLRSPGFFRFALVRNPLARAAAAYEAGPNNYRRDVRAAAWRRLQAECPAVLLAGGETPARRPALSVAEFVRCVTSARTPADNDPRWRPLTHLCALDKIPYSRLVAVEHFAQDAPQLLQDLGWQADTALLNLQAEPVWERELAQYFSAEDVRRLLKYYAKDFEAIGHERVALGKTLFFTNSEVLQEKYNRM